VQLAGSSPFFRIAGAVQKVAENRTVYAVLTNRLTALTRDSLLAFTLFRDLEVLCTMRHVNVNSNYIPSGGHMSRQQPFRGTNV